MGDHHELESVLRSRVDGEVRFDAQALAAYSTDGSNFRQVPIGVVVPATIDAGAEAVRVCAEQGVPLLSRGGGTSLAGQCTNHAVVIDWTKHCNRLVSVDAEKRTCIVEPGIVLDDLNRELADLDLRYGPEPATHPNCTLGGMIGNNSCGATAQRSGKVSDNISRLEVMLPDGSRFWCGRTTDEEYDEIERQGDPRAAVHRQLRRLRDEYADDIRAGFPDIPRRVSGYNLDQLLPENDFHVARALVGSESTLVTVLHAELDLIPVLHERVLVVLGFDSIVDAAHAVPDVLPFEPVALEGVDHFLVRDERVKHMHGVTLDSLPEGDGFLMVQFGGNDKEEVEQRAKAMVEALQEGEHSPSAEFLDDPEQEDRFWAVREAGLGATAHVPDRPDTFEGWEDSAVPVEKLGDYLDDLYHLYDDFGYLNDTGPSLYGHFGQGCVHTRIPFDLFTADGVHTYRRFMESAARLVTSYGGSLSGEHGDGQSRGELLTVMFGERLVGAFEEMKAIFDPDNRMNPGKVVHPAKLDEHLRMGADWSPHQKRRLWFAYPEDDGSFVQAAQRCVGVGKCRQHSNDGHQVMCPSYQVTGDERHSTRGSARLLYEMLDGHADGTIKDGWRSEEVRDALDLCLACKGCKTDCPVNTDMATYKAEFLAHHYEGRLRPRADYALGYLPTMSRLVQQAGLAPLANRLSGVPVLRRLATRGAGLEDRTIPKFATQSLQDWWKDRPTVTGDRGTVVLWPDTFTNRFEPDIGRAAVEVMEDAGWTVAIPTEPLCCGLTWISTGQLKTARKQLRHAAGVVSDHLHRGDLVVGLEPSCTAALRSDGPDLLPEDLDVKKLGSSTVTLAELLREHTPGWEAPQVPHDQALAQVHCHQHAIMGWEADQELLKDAGVDAEHLESGCCGLAGNFGFTAGHGQVSHDLAHRVLVPRVNEADEGTAILADGFSCRTQIREYADASRRPVHLAELIAEGLHARDGR